jgi:xanthine phosphoribosyltransferase
MIMQTKTFDEVLEKFRTIAFVEKFDMIVAIANGGIIPAAIINQRLDIEIRMLRINLRDNNQKPKYDSPKLLLPIDFEFKDKTILLVDDRIRTGVSLKLATELLQGAKLIKTFAVNGNADYALYNEECFKFPWIV